MQQREVNDRQLEVLSWIAGGCPDGAMNDLSYKTTAVALMNRGLANVSKRGGWHAAITEAGHHYLEHGTYPGTPALNPQPKKTQRQKPAKAPPAQKPLAPADEPQSLRDVADQKTTETPKRAVPVPKSLRKPHPVVQEMRDGKKPMPITKSVQPRALRIVQAIAVAAESEGWRVQSTAQSRTQWDRGWDPKDLFVISTGECTVGIRLTQENDRMPHVPTAYELRQKERYSYSRIPEYDYAPSKRLKLELNGWGAHGRPYRWADRRRWRLDDKLGQAIDEIAIRHNEAMQERLEKEAREAERERMYEVAVSEAKVVCRESNRAQELARQVSAWRQAQLMRDYIAAMEQHIERIDPDDAPAALQWLDWSRRFAEASDPLAQPVRMPDDPEMTDETLSEFLPTWARRTYRGW